MADIPVVITTQGAQPTPPATLLENLIASVASINPGYTANLPGSLIEDLSSTATYALVQSDSARVELLNSLTPFSANEFMLSQLGQIYLGPGAAPAPPTNTSVYVVFSAEDQSSNPLSGQLIPVGFTVTDGTYQYIVQDGGVTASGGSTIPLFCLASIPGQWAVAANTVNSLVTSEPPTVTITCNNPTAGISGATAETAEQYQARVLQAGQAISTGTPQELKTLLGEAGLPQNLISVRQQSGGFWSVIAGGGDPYLTAQAIYDSGLNVAGLVGSILNITAITNATNGKITTEINHGYSPGQQATATGIVGMTPLNGVLFTVVTVVDEKNFTINVNTTSYPTYVSGGVISPNLRNVTVSIQDYPDVYQIIFIDPPQQAVTMSISWSTISTNFVSDAAMSQAAQPAIEAYVNSIVVGQPMSLLVLQQTFLSAVAAILPAGLFSNLAFSVSINGVSTSPTGDLFIGDPESSFNCQASNISVIQA